MIPCNKIFRLSNVFRKNAYFITGSGTGVGKTYAAAFLAKQIVESGGQVAYMKAVQTGLSNNKPDMELVRELCPQILDLPESLSCPYCFMLEASPHLAAKCENRKIHPAKIVGNFFKIRKKYPNATILVEGAGGLMVPIIKSYMMINLIADLELPAVLVTLPSLGTINHTLLSYHALRSKKIPIEGIAFSTAQPELYQVTRDNMMTIKELTGVKNCGIIPLLKTYS